jgi:hypothetical protein
MGESEYSQIYTNNKQLLAEDGLFTDERKQPLPELPGKIGLVTSVDSDAHATPVMEAFEEAGIPYLVARDSAMESVGVRTRDGRRDSAISNPVAA